MGRFWVLSLEEPNAQRGRHITLQNFPKCERGRTGTWDSRPSSQPSSYAAWTTVGSRTQDSQDPVIHLECLKKKGIVSGVMQPGLEEMKFLIRGLHYKVFKFFNQKLCYSSKFNTTFLGGILEGQPKYICTFCLTLAFHPLMPSSLAHANLVLFHCRSPADAKRYKPRPRLTRESERK